MISTPDSLKAEEKKTVVPVGILYSLSGHYGVIGREMLNGILLAIEEANASPDYNFTLAPVVLNPAGSLEKYAEYCRELLHRHGVKHIVGCYTSASRKQILPLIESADALLWHSARYEGFESSNNVMYLGAAPNQHVIPMIKYVLEQYEPKIYHVGSNYVWSWEIDRITREAIEPVGGELVASRLLALGETDVQAVIDDIIEKRPPVVLVTLVGVTAYRFYQAWHAAATEHAWLRSPERVKLSLTLCEPEVDIVGSAALEGYLVSAVYFQSIEREENQRFLQRYRERFGEHSSPSVDSEAAWLSGHFLARAIARAHSADVADVRQAVYQDVIEGPGGCTRIDPENNHAWLTPRLARCGADGRFQILWQAPEPVKPDPWLTWVDLNELVENPSSLEQEGG
ncbi:ABC transporter substrate-binding protein [Mangrovibacter sp. MFB070]|uniref:transporter substrate-binding domain-containing protein n=1 Tax=Mangrovibacter sp. MFB070 TaxID=1224318 RepID=UPI0004D4EE48|nr:transporter substrate-binding domain-containing protein [Mangrovibacter sp. MFB070]KEA51436.1 ABC transporter substrate-binding protein [Mangrovibacter sp. MFB070]